MGVRVAPLEARAGTRPSREVILEHIYGLLMTYAEPYYIENLARIALESTDELLAALASSTASKGDD